MMLQALVWTRPYRFLALTGVDIHCHPGTGIIQDRAPGQHGSSLTTGALPV
jgi:hypothetical protein